MALHPSCTVCYPRSTSATDTAYIHSGWCVVVGAPRVDLVVVVVVARFVRRRDIMLLDYYRPAGARVYAAGAHSQTCGLLALDTPTDQGMSMTWFGLVCRRCFVAMSDWELGTRSTFCAREHESHQAVKLHNEPPHGKDGPETAVYAGRSSRRRRSRRRLVARCCGLTARCTTGVRRR